MDYNTIAAKTLEPHTALYPLPICNPLIVRHRWHANYRSSVALIPRNRAPIIEVYLSEFVMNREFYL